jgi:hypothetical protein
MHDPVVETIHGHADVGVTAYPGASAADIAAALAALPEDHILISALAMSGTVEFAFVRRSELADYQTEVHAEVDEGDEPLWIDVVADALGAGGTGSAQLASHPLLPVGGTMPPQHRHGDEDDEAGGCAEDGQHDGGGAGGGDSAASRAKDGHDAHEHEQERPHQTPRHVELGEPGRRREHHDAGDEEGR